MTNAQQLTAYLAAILTALAEIKDHSAPASTMYMFVNHSLDTWNTLRAVMEKNGLITYKNHLVTLTPKGLAMADQINAALAAKKK